MTILKRAIQTGLFFSVLFLFSCKDLTELNINPNGTDPSTINPTFLLTNVLTNTAKDYLDISYWDPFAGTMQMMQKDAFSSSNNDYDWDDQSWDDYYALLRDNQKAFERGEELDNDFVKGVSLVMKSFLFGLITDLWGDAPYSQALKGNQGELKFTHPVYDPQKDIYLGIIDDLQTASSLFAKGIRKQEMAGMYITMEMPANGKNLPILS